MIARTVRSLPYSRVGSFGTLSVVGFQLTQSSPSIGSCVPSIRLPLNGRPTEVACVQRTSAVTWTGTLLRRTRSGIAAGRDLLTRRSNSGAGAT